MSARRPAAPTSLGAVASTLMRERASGAAAGGGGGGESFQQNLLQRLLQPARALIGKASDRARDLDPDVFRRDRGAESGLLGAARGRSDEEELAERRREDDGDDDSDDGESGVGVTEDEPINLSKAQRVEHRERKSAVIGRNLEDGLARLRALLAGGSAAASSAAAAGGRDARADEAEAADESPRGSGSRYTF